MLLRDRVNKIRSKNAGPFTVTIDIFCHDRNDLHRLRSFLCPETLSRVYRVGKEHLEIYEIPSLNVIKISFPRAHSQGSRLDRDMHGAQFAELLNEMDLPYNFDES